MSSLRSTLQDLLETLSEKNYDESFAQYRLWLNIGGAHGHITSQDQVNDDLWRIARPDVLKDSALIHPTARLLVRFIRDMEADPKISRHALGLHRRRCTLALSHFFEMNLSLVRSWNSSGKPTSFLTDVNLIAHWANLGYVEEEVIRDQILQSLISRPILHEHQADALIILFNLAGATFEVYAEPSVVGRCFELLKGHRNRSRNSVKRELIQEVINLRERGWKGLPPPPMFKSSPASADQEDPAATPITISLGLPSGGLEPQVLRPSPLDPFATPETDTNPGSPTPQSPSISITTLSDSVVTDTFDDEPSLGSTVVTPHDTFYLEDGNVEVLCGDALFRVNTSVLSFNSPVLRQMFTKANLAAAESPNGCPRILSSDPAADFATLLKIIYFPEFPERNKVPDFTTFSSLFRITTKYEMPGFRSRILDVVHDAYPETFEGLVPSKQIGESVFSGPAPHPNEVLNLFIQQKFTSALPMAYYMAAQRGLDSLMDRRLPPSARLSPEILQVAIRGLLALREMELKAIHRLILGSKGSRPCSRPNCPSRTTTGPRVSEAHQKVVDRIADSAHSGTKVLQVLSLREVCGGEYVGFCENCVEGWETGHVDVRKNAWGMLSDVFGLKG